MKKVTLLLMLTTLVQASISAQYVKPTSLDQQDPADFYLSISTGIDNYTGILGIGAIFPVYDDFGLRVGAGLGGWGGKISAGMIYHDLLDGGFGFGIGYSYCTGLNDVDLPLEDANGIAREVNMDLLSVGSINLTVNKNWVLKRGTMIYIESGYAVPTGGNNFYQIRDGSILSAQEELILDIMRPGGLIVALGLNIPL